MEKNFYEQNFNAKINDEFYKFVGKFIQIYFILV
jgi:hypothetical protein